MTEHPNRPENKLLILLLHGIRTDAAWQQRVRSTIQRHAPDATIIPIKYDEYFDALRFLCPVGTRGRAIDRVTKALRDAVATYPGRDLILIAHSFGTYAIAKAIQRNADIRPKRLLLAGSIVKQSFDWAAFRGTIDVLNDCGSFDIWPILAKSTTWGYGASGTLGFGSPVVTDRYFPFRHSDFFDHEKDPSFIETHWVPWIVAGVKTESTFENQRPASPWHLLILTTVFQIKYVLLLIVAMILCWHGYIPAMPSASWFSSDPGWCEGTEPLDEDLFPDPRTAAPNFVTQEQISETPAVSDSESYTLRYYNDTDADYRLLLCDCTLYYSHVEHPDEAASPWIVLPFCRKVDYDPFNYLGSPNGWYAIFVLTSPSAKPTYIGTFNLYKHNNHRNCLTLTGTAASPKLGDPNLLCK